MIVGQQVVERIRQFLTLCGIKTNQIRCHFYTSQFFISPIGMNKE
ncbi:hypothetical protein VP96_03043 [Vibrio cholerae]|nr:hypothetical protein VP96_03043 [Vibrio cholerae]